MRQTMRVAWALGLVLAVQAADAAQAPVRYAYTSRTTRTLDKQTGVRTARTSVQQGSGVRFDVTDGRRRAITLFVGEEAWTWDPVARKGWHRKLTPDEVLRVRRSYMPPSAEVGHFRAQGGRKTASAVVRGTRCDVYVLKTKDGWTHRLWVAQGPASIRLRQESRGTSKVAFEYGGQMKSRAFRSVTEFTDWQVGKTLPASLFRRPANVKFAEASPSVGMPPGHPLVPGRP